MSGNSMNKGCRNGIGIVPTLLKGIDYSHRYYPQGHWRVMRDVDLLIDEQDIDRAKDVLLELGHVAVHRGLAAPATQARRGLGWLPFLPGLLGSLQAEPRSSALRSMTGSLRMPPS